MKIVIFVAVFKSFLTFYYDTNYTYSCNVDDDFDCGYPGIPAEECESKNCCYINNSLSGKKIVVFTLVMSDVALVTMLVLLFKNINVLVVIKI